ncbi:MAG: hypothetical protein MN733_04965 [Nitrososphaera sp.]|nr:hypothetical protein [Nitrososphaera sp.]
MVTKIDGVLPPVWNEKKIRAFKERVAPFHPNVWNKVDGILQSLWFNVLWIFVGGAFFFIAMPMGVFDLEKPTTWVAMTLMLLWLIPPFTGLFTAQSKVCPPVWQRKSLYHFFLEQRWKDAKLLELLGSLTPSQDKKISEWGIEYSAESPYIIIWRNSIQWVPVDTGRALLDCEEPYLVFNTENQKVVPPE